MKQVPVQVLLVDDHEVVREGFRRLFGASEGIEIVAEALTGEEAMQRYRELQPDVVVLDLSMPGIGGLEACRRILAHDPQARLIVFSVHENEAFVSRALEVGVRGYVSKRSASQIMVDVVRQVAEGRAFIAPEILQAMVETPGGGKSEAPLHELSAREFEVLRLLAEGYTVNHAAEILSLSAKTVHHHHASLRRKLGIRTPLDLLRVAVQAGIVTP